MKGRSSQYTLLTWLEQRENSLKHLALVHVKRKWGQVEWEDFWIKQSLKWSSKFYHQREISASFIRSWA